MLQRLYEWMMDKAAHAHADSLAQPWWALRTIRMIRRLNTAKRVAW